MYLWMDIELKDGVNEGDFRKKVNKTIFDRDIPIQGVNGFFSDHTLHWDDTTLRGFCRVWNDEDLEQLNQMEEVISFEGTWEDGHDNFWVVVGDKEGLHLPCYDMTRWEWFIGYKGEDIDDYYEWFYNDGKLEDEEKEGNDYYLNRWLRDKVQIEEWLKTNKEGSLRTINQKEVQ